MKAESFFLIESHMCAWLKLSQPTRNRIKTLVQISKMLLQKVNVKHNGRRSEQGRQFLSTPTQKDNGCSPQLKREGKQIQVHADLKRRNHIYLEEKNPICSYGHL